MNVLFLMADQLSVRVMSTYGNPIVKTPNMDKLAREGALFKNAYCTYPQCSPSRATIASGLMPHSHKIEHNVDDDEVIQLRSDEHLTEGMFRAKGFETYYFGFWHQGKRSNLDCYKDRIETYKDEDFKKKELPGLRIKNPKSRPLLDTILDKQKHRPEFMGINDTVEVIPEIDAAFDKFVAKNPRFPQLGFIGKSLIPPKHQPTTLLTDELIDKITTLTNPWMMTWSVTPPHDPILVPEPYYGMYPRTMDLMPFNFTADMLGHKDGSEYLLECYGEKGLLEFMGIYYGMVSYVDDQLGRILQCLKDTGKRDNTLIVFTADHGDMAGGHGSILKGVDSFFEEMVRVPLMIKFPDIIDAGTIIEEPVSQLNLMPTLLDFAEIKIPDFAQGHSMRKLLENGVPLGRPVVCERKPHRMIRIGKFKYVWYDEDYPEEFFDLEKDPGELENLFMSADYFGEALELKAMLGVSMGRTKDPLLGAFKKSLI